MCQIGEPVNPVTVVTPNAAAARAASCIRSGGAPAHPLELTVAPDVGRQHPAMALVDWIAYRLPDQVSTQRPAAETSPIENRTNLAGIIRLGHRPGDVEVIAPARQLKAIEPPPGGPLNERGQRQVCPLSGEQGHRVTAFTHRICLLARTVW